MATDPPASVLFEWYERYIGEPDARTDVYAGFGLFFAGTALAACGLVLFLWSASVEPGGEFYWTLRQIAIVFASLGLPAGMVGIVVLLPVSRRALYAAGAGIAVCLLAMTVFVAVYPSNWNVQGATDYSASGIALYAGGLAVVVGSTGAALVAHQLERTRPTIEEREDDREAVSDEQIARDIDEAMDGVNLSWGGVERKRGRKLAVDTGTEDVDRTSFDSVEATTTRASGGAVEDAVSNLQGLQGGQKEQATGSGTDDQAAALAELREKKRAEAMATRESPTERLRAKVAGLFDRSK
ncbi:MAG: permease [Halalkalicoccus sp.]